MFSRFISSVVKNKLYLYLNDVLLCSSYYLPINDEQIFIETFLTLLCFFLPNIYLFLKTSLIPFKYMHNLETREGKPKIFIILGHCIDWDHTLHAFVGIYDVS